MSYELWNWGINYYEIYCEKMRHEIYKEEVRYDILGDEDIKIRQVDWVKIRQIKIKILGTLHCKSPHFANPVCIISHIANKTIKRCIS